MDLTPTNRLNLPQLRWCQPLLQLRQRTPFRPLVSNKVKTKSRGSKGSSATGTTGISKATVCETTDRIRMVTPCCFWFCCCSGCFASAMVAVPQLAVPPPPPEEELDPRYSKLICFNCGDPGHFVGNCVKPKVAQGSITLMYPVRMRPSGSTSEIVVWYASTKER